MYLKQFRWSGLKNVKSRAILWSWALTTFVTVSDHRKLDQKFTHVSPNEKNTQPKPGLKLMFL